MWLGFFLGLSLATIVYLAVTIVPYFQRKLQKYQKAIDALTNYVGKVGLQGALALLAKVLKNSDLSSLDRGVHSLNRGRDPLFKETEVVQGENHLEITYHRGGRDYHLVLPYHAEWTDVNIHLMLPDGKTKEIHHPPGVPLMVPARELGGRGYKIITVDGEIDVNGSSLPSLVSNTNEAVDTKEGINNKERINPKMMEEIDSKIMEEIDSKMMEEKKTEKGKEEEIPLLS